MYIDHRGREICSIMSTHVRFETDHIYLLRDSKMQNLGSLRPVQQKVLSYLGLSASHQVIQCQKSPDWLGLTEPYLSACLCLCFCMFLCNGMSLICSCMSLCYSFKPQLQDFQRFIC